MIAAMSQGTREMVAAACIGVACAALRPGTRWEAILATALFIAAFHLWVPT